MALIFNQWPSASHWSRLCLDVVCMFEVHFFYALWWLSCFSVIPGRNLWLQYSRVLVLLLFLTCMQGIGVRRWRDKPLIPPNVCPLPVQGVLMSLTWSGCAEEGCCASRQSNLWPGKLVGWRRCQRIWTVTNDSCSYTAGKWDAYQFPACCRFLNRANY